MADIGGYVLHLYCDGIGDNDYHQERVTRNRFPDEYVDNTRNCKQRAYRKARDDGWVINSKFDRAFCPGCAQKRKPKWMQKPLKN